MLCASWLLTADPARHSIPRPPGFPEPIAAAQIDWTPELAELGRHLFYDKRLSVNKAISCASCHKQELAFSDGRVTSPGALGEVGTRNAMSLVNLAYRDSLGWQDQHGFSEQLDRPLFSEAPLEMGASRSKVPAALLADKYYQQQFNALFPGHPPSWTNIKTALVAFELTLISGSSTYDDWLFQDIKPNEQTTAGMALYFSDRLACGSCHGGIGFNNEFFARGSTPSTQLVNNGLIVGQQFRIPTMRNIETTAPYMHDGRFKTLDEVIDFYAEGPAPQHNLTGFELSAAERDELLAFLASLTDAKFLSNPDFQNPRQDN